MLPRTCRSVAALSMMMGLAAASHASDWGTVPAISSTMGVHDGRVCVGEATRGDIGCPAYAPEVGTDGAISATRFVGDGSGLTGVVASTADRIVSGTTSMVAVSGTGFVSLTQAGTNTGWFDPARGLVTLGVSATGDVKAANMLVRGVIDIVTGTHNVLLGSSTGSANTGSYLHAIGTITAQYNSGSHVNAIGYQVARYNGGSHVNAFGNMAAMYNSGSHVNAIGFRAAQNNTGGSVDAMGRLAAGDNTGANVVALGNTAAQSNTANDVVAIGRNAALINTFNNVVALGYNAQSDKANQIILGNPSIVEVSTAGVILAAGVSTSGVVTATRFAGDGSGLTNLQGASADRVVSGTTSLVAISTTGYISLTQASTNTGWFDPTRGLVTLGVSTTGPISATRGYFSGNVGMGTTAPTTALEVSGTVSATYVKLADNDNLPCTAERNGTLRFFNGIVSICRAQ